MISSKRLMIIVFKWKGLINPYRLIRNKLFIHCLKKTSFRRLKLLKIIKIIYSIFIKKRLYDINYKIKINMNK